MVFDWNEAESFHRHSEEMKRFRRHHAGGNAGGRKDGGLNIIRLNLLAIPVPVAGNSGGLPGETVRTPVVPLWSVEISGGSQN